ncbi:MAG: DUF4271 domain-containing protein [Ferruginibacter sp.]
MNSFAQDSIVTAQVVSKTDSSIKPQSQTIVPVPSLDSCRNYIIKKLVLLNVTGSSQLLVQSQKLRNGKDWLFYYLLALLFFFGLIRMNYARYFKDLFRFFFRTSLRVIQIREQLVQSGLQSLFFNIFFAFSFGAYIYLLSVYYESSLQVSNWLIPIGAALCLLVLYMGKYLFLKLSGWLFSIGTATETYTFIVFLINKVAGVAILPFLILIAFAATEIVDIAVTLSLVLVVGLFLYRFLRAYQPVQSEVKVGRLHFLIFFLAIEIAPLLIIYKLLIRFF